MDRKVFIVGVSGAVGGLLARRLLTQDVAVQGLVRRQDQASELAGLGVLVTVGDLASMSGDELAVAFEGADAVVSRRGARTPLFTSSSDDRTEESWTRSPRWSSAVS